MSIFNLLPVIKDCNADVDACHVALERVTQLLVAQGLVAYMPCAATTAVVKPLPPLLSLVHSLTRRTRDLAPAVSPCVCCDNSTEDVLVAPSLPDIFGPDLLNAVNALEYVIAVYVRTVLQPIGLLACNQAHYINTTARAILSTPVSDNMSFADASVDYRNKFEGLSELLISVCDYVTHHISTDFDASSRQYFDSLTAVLETDGDHDAEPAVPKKMKKVMKNV